MVEIKQKVLKILKDRELTITAVANLLKIHYITASKYLAVLEAEGKIQYKRIGMAKLFSLKKRR